MKIRLITISREEDKNANALFTTYADRLKHYTSFESINIKPARTASVPEQLKSDAAQLLKKIRAEDHVVVLDERGWEMTSAGFAHFLSRKMNMASRSICFIIGGAYGFDQSIIERSDDTISLSQLTLPHQLAKVVFAEQLYRAFTIIRNEKYHH